MAKKAPAEGGSVSFNMTPMIDIVFNTLIFFVVIAQFVDLDNAQMNLPQPHSPQVKEDDTDKEKVVVNVVPEKDRSGKATGFVQSIRISGVDYLPEDLSAVQDKLTNTANKYEKNIVAIVRADKGIYFSGVRPVMDACAQAGIENVMLAADKQGQ